MLLLPSLQILISFLRSLLKGFCSSGKKKTTKGVLHKPKFRRLRKPHQQTKRVLNCGKKSQHKPFFHTGIIYKPASRLLGGYLTIFQCLPLAIKIKPVWFAARVSPLLAAQLDCLSHVATHHSSSSVMASGSVKGNGVKRARALNDLRSREIHLLEVFDGPKVKREKNWAKMINQANPSRNYYFHVYLKMSQNNTFLFLTNFSIFFNVILEGLEFLSSEIILRIYNFFFKFLQNIYCVRPRR